MVRDVPQDLASLDHAQQQLAELETELHRLSTCPPWEARVTYLVQLPGFGLLTAMTVLSAIGDVTRFPTDKQLVGYAGLGAGVHDSLSWTDSPGRPDPPRSRHHQAGPS